ncbi:uncharacterized protein LOC6548809 isoform X7 [Drosophila erecta]|uniref:Uncharacterized protein, isoform D n=1 Tax=Drosophila erecta TaxID=7220 RepID=A0A0Q5VW64_DROER|nr:uncharacterized protein LOC6548809 isoform X7 [Drosophila erecta]KQS62537.1 uncharacterized protein Dere_GG20536, isoform D [Drosophila erecta]
MDLVEVYYFISFILIFLILIRAYICPHHKWKCVCCLQYRHESGRNRLNDPEDPSSNHYGDIFFIEPGSVEANRIRDQLEKDEKDLPSYDEVMRMCNLTTPTAAAAGMPLPQSPLGEPGPIGIAALPAPPYSETDPHAAPAGGATVIAMESMEPSTSRAAQIPPSSSGSGPPAPLPTTTV